MFTFAATDFMTLVDVECSNGSAITREKRTYMMGDKRKVVVDFTHIHDSGIKRVRVAAFILDPHEYVWYDSDGEERIDQCEWRCVWRDKADDASHDMLLAQAYGVLACVRW